MFFLIIFLFFVVWTSILGLVMDKDDLIKLKLSVFFVFLGIIGYPFTIYFAHFFPNFFIDTFAPGLSRETFIRFILSVSPMFSVFFLIAAWNFTSIQIGSNFDRIIKISIRIIFLVYFIFVIYIPFSAIAGSIYKLSTVVTIKTIIWRFVCIFAYLYFAYLFLNFRDKANSIITMAVLMINLIQDLTYYFLQIEKSVSNSTELRYSIFYKFELIVIFIGTCYILIKLYFLIKKEISTRIQMENF